MSSPDITPLIRSLERRDRLSEEEKEALRSGPWRTKDYAAGDEIVSFHDRPGECCLLLEGFTGRTIDFADGRRQIAELHVPGDFVDLHGLFMHQMDHNIVALTPAKAAFIPHEAVRAITERLPHLTRMLWMLTTVDCAVHRNWIACLGRRSVEQHLTFVLCEMFLRLQAVGLTRDMSFDLPLTQEQIKDVIGASIVHVNRMLQQLRAGGLITWERPTVTINNWEGFVRFAEFDATYLNLHREAK